MSARPSSTGELVTDPLRNAYLRRLVLVIVAVAVGALLGAWLTWDYVPDGSVGSYVLGQAPIFVGAALVAAVPLWWALRARRRWMAARPSDDETT
jgi:hypothetical protein